MQFQHLMTARPPVQPIHVLRDQREFGNPPFHLDQGEVARIRLGLPHPFLPPGVPLPDQLRIAAERIRRRQFFRVVARPQSGLGFAEGRHTTFSGDAGAGQHGDPVGRTQTSNQQSGNSRQGIHDGAQSSWGNRRVFSITRTGSPGMALRMEKYSCFLQL